MNAQKNFIWAVDITDLESVVQKPIISALENLAVTNKINLQLVYVLSSKDAEIPNDYLKFQFKEFEDQIRIEFKKNLVTNLSMTPSKIISNTSSSLRNGIKSLVEYALANAIDLIIVNTHARKGMKRISMGSFTESLLAEVKTPVLVFNPHSTSLPAQNLKVLFPTDDQHDPPEVFKEALSWSASLKADITVLHTKKILEVIRHSPVPVLLIR